MRYVVHHRYAGEHGGVRYGPWVAGEEVDLDEDVAAAINEHSPAALTPAPVEPEAARPAARRRTD